MTDSFKEEVKVFVYLLLDLYLGMSDQDCSQGENSYI